MRRVVLCLILCAASVGAAAAQAPEAASPLAKLYACSAIEKAEDRLACFDREVAAVRTGEEGGQFTAIDAGRVEEIQRESFGFSIPSLPKLALPRFGGDDREDGGRREIDEVESVLAQVRTAADGKLRFTLENGQIWRQIDTTKNLRAKKGAAVTVRRAALGSFQMAFGSGAAIRVRREE